jgi:hypothetical protein
MRRHLLTTTNTVIGCTLSEVIHIVLSIAIIGGRIINSGSRDELLLII